MRFALRNEADAAEVDAYFNGFHDGFVKELRLRSHDVFIRDGPGPTSIAHELTGGFDLELGVAHYNYTRGTQPHDRIVRCVFRSVGDFHLDLRRRRAEEWPIKVIEFLPADGHFVLVIVWGRFEGESWGTQRSELCTFEEAEFEER